MAFAINGAANAIKVPHRTQFDTQSVKKQLGITVSVSGHFIYQMGLLSERKLNSVESFLFFEKVFDTKKQNAEQKRNDRAIKIVYSLLAGKDKSSLLESSMGTP